MICKIWTAVYVQPPLWQGLHSYEIRLAVATGMPNSPGDSGTGTRRAESGGTTKRHRFSWKLLQQHDAARRDEVGCWPRGTIKGAQGLRVQLGNGLHAPRRRPSSVLTTHKRYTTVFMHRGSAVAPVGNSEETERARTGLRFGGRERSLTTSSVRKLDTKAARSRPGLRMERRPCISVAPLTPRGAVCS